MSVAPRRQSPVGSNQLTRKSQGIGALASLKADTLYRAWGLLVLAGLGIGGIVVPASIITTIICPDVRPTLPRALPYPPPH